MPAAALVCPATVDVLASAAEELLIMNLVNTELLLAIAG
jgi:hypothetical protein